MSGVLKEIDVLRDDNVLCTENIEKNLKLRALRVTGSLVVEQVKAFWVV